ncbi:MAG: hypothetical protein ABW185_23505 [Sedimenticola sp.]
MSRLTYGNGCLEINQLYERYRFECIESGQGEPVGWRLFIEHLTALFPNASKTRKNIGKLKQTVYTGLTLRDYPDNVTTTDFTSIANYLTEDNINSVHADTNEIACEIETAFLSNGLKVNKHVTFHRDGSWNLKVAGKNVDLKKHGILDKYATNRDNINLVIRIVKQIHLCCGVRVTRNINVSRFHTLENWHNSDEGNTRVLRTLSCNRIVPFNSQITTCLMCQRMTFTSSESSSIKAGETSEKSNNVTKQDFRKLIPGATDEMLDLLMDQAKNTNRSPTGRRWSRRMITTCLQLYTRSPHGYDALRASNILVLPSPSVLVLYKNMVKQDTGFNDDVFLWMYEEASRKGMNEDGWSGGLIFDEMSIQPDLQISKCGNFVQLKGFTELGEEGNMCSILRSGVQKKKLGTHILQIVFLGLTGFRFPIAHFVTTQIQGYELYTIFWEAVDQTERYGFKVLYTSMDGAQCNRTFMHIHIDSALVNRYSVQSPCSNRCLVFMMDFSHVAKKIRNNVLKSGIHKACTRLLTLTSGYTVQWQMFVDAFEWDRQNCLSLHRKLSHEHLHPNNQEKMRNHLAEEVLNSEMLNLMIVYRDSLGDKGEILDGAIEFLRNTSLLIAFFRDMRPVRVLDDQRLKDLTQVCHFFHSWKQSADKSTDKNKYKAIMSLQCHEDIQACGVGFRELCELILPTSNISIVPGLINSDPVENHFNQQRSTFHGANTNPNVLQYSKAQNSVIISQTPVSRKANAVKAKENTMPCDILKQPLRKRKVTSLGEKSEKIEKVQKIRF